MRLPHPATIVDTCRLTGRYALSADPRIARHEGRIIVSYVRRGLLLRVWTVRPLTERQLLMGAPGAVVGAWYRGRHPPYS